MVIMNSGLWWIVFIYVIAICVMYDWWLMMIFIVMNGYDILLHCDHTYGLDMIDRASGNSQWLEDGPPNCRPWVKVPKPCTGKLGGDSTFGWKPIKESPLFVSCLPSRLCVVGDSVSPVSGVGPVCHYCSIWWVSRTVVGLLKDSTR